MFDPSQLSIGEVVVRYGEAKLKTVKDPERLTNSIKARAPYWADIKVAEIDVDT